MIAVMTTFGLVVVGLLMLVGLVGVVVPIVPGLLLIVGAALWWAIGDGGSTAHWVTFAIMSLIAAAGTFLKYAVPARHTARAGASNVTMVFALLLGVVGLFVIPVVGAPVGFVVGVYLAELRRHKRHEPAWGATKAALKGFALAMLIEFTAGALMIGTWAIGLFVT
jgi:uncharacterized protein